MNYWQKIDQNPFSDLIWNLPEQPLGTLNLIGGNHNNFATEIKIAEFLLQTFRLKTLSVCLPETLQSQLPPLKHLTFLPATPSGSFANSPQLITLLQNADFNLLLGDFSKNSTTAHAIFQACSQSTTSLLLTRDTLDLIDSSPLEKLFIKDQLFIFTSLIQLQKLFHTILYPKIILLSMSLLQTIETLHKFTLSYPLTIITFHRQQLIIAHAGIVNSIPLEKTSYSPISLWNGELAAKIAIFNLFNPNNPLSATTSAIFYN